MFKKLKKSEFIRTMSLMKKWLWPYALGVIGDNAITAFCYNIMLAIILRDLFNAAVQAQKMLLVRALVLAGISTLAAVVSQPLFRYIVGRSVKKTMADIRMKAYEQMEDLPLAYFEGTHSGSLTSRLTNDIGVMEDLYSRQISTLVFFIMVGVGAMVVMLFMEWHLSLLLMASGIASMYVNTLFSKPLRRVGDTIQQRRGEATGRLLDLIAGFQVAKMFQLEKVVTGRYTEENEGVAGAAVKQGRINALLNVINYLFYSFRTIGLLILGIFMISRKAMDIGALVAIYQLQGNMSAMFNNIGGFVAQVQGSLAGAGRVFELMEQPQEPERYGVPAASGGNSVIELRDVVFGYEEGKKVLDGLSITVKKGQVAALVGPSGGGKSTVIKLLLGFYPPDGGNIIMNGKSMGQYPLAQLRDMTAYVPQDPFLFDGTIEENIRYGRLNAAKEEIVAAAEAANAHGFITEQSQGYDTLVGERGNALSGGQKQRIAIARALNKNAPILLMDEATSALDSESEKLVREALDKLMEGRTVLVVAHRLSTVENADIIYVVDGGRVVESGRHGELLAKGGLYKRLYELGFRQEEG